MSKSSEQSSGRRPIWARANFWINLAIVGIFCAGVAGVRHWRAGQFAGYGLAGVYHEGRDFKGKVFRRSVDPVIDISDKTDAIYDTPVFSVEWTGSIVLRRAGRYAFATESDDGSLVELGGKVMLDNGGIHGPRRKENAHMLKAGVHSFKVRYVQAGAGGKMRLFWSPAGRRGGLEYISPTLLRPVPPEQVNPDETHDVPPRDWPALVMLFLLALAAALALLRGPVARGVVAILRSRQGRRDLLVFCLIFAAALTVRMYDLNEAGRTWDEDVYWAAGRNFVQNLLAGDFRSESWAWNNEHPGLGKWIYGPGTLLMDSFEAARATAAIIGALTCALLFLVGRDLINRRVGLLGAGLASVLPHLLAHHKILGLEAPSGLLYLLTIWFFYRSLSRVGNSGYHLAAGICAGLLISTRVSNLSVLVVIGVLYLALNRRAIFGEGRFPVPVTLGLAPVIALFTFFLVWPYLWENPMKHLGDMLVHWDTDKYLEWFFGRKQKPPWFYFPLYFSVTMPAAVLAAWVLSLVRVAWRRDLGHITLLLWFFAPYVVMLSPLARDGVRYLVPSLLAACLMAGAGLEWAAVGAARLVRRARLATPVTAFGGVALCFYSLYCGSTVHPYYLDYYNEITGGPAKVASRHTFEIGWWGEGIKEACDYIGRVAPLGSRVWGYVHPTHVIALREDLKRVNGPGLADYIMFNDLFNARPKLPNHRVIYVVRAAGAPLVWVYERTNLNGTAP